MCVRTCSSVHSLRGVGSSPVFGRAAWEVGAGRFVGVGRELAGAIGAVVTLGGGGVGLGSGACLGGELLGRVVVAAFPEAAIGFGPGEEETAHTTQDSVLLADVIKAAEFYALLPALIK